MRAELGDMFADWAAILDSVMPGGDNWKQAKRRSGGKDICRRDCPAYASPNNCKGLCTYENRRRNWRKAPASTLNLAVLLHVIEWFDYYNLGDLEGLNEQSPTIISLRRKILAKLGKQIKEEKP